MKQINAREFQKSFGRITEKLRAGEKVQITKHGNVVGTFVKETKKVQWPDVVAYLRKHSCPAEVGDRVLKDFNESIS
jgi:hypothetical protein